MSAKHSRSQPAVSVVVCTRNPDRSTFARTFQHLADQSLPADQWEVVVVDNASQPPVSQPHTDRLPACRLVLESKPGIAEARVRGIRESHGDLVVLVDDDNLLDADYLVTAVRIADSFPQIGAFGGRITLESATPLPDWLEPFRSHLALADFTRDEWALVTAECGVIPYGAGLCIRRGAALHWADDAACAERRAALRSRDGAMRASEDTDLVLTCLDQGFGAGRFTALHLRHVIPEARLDYAYQRRLAYDIGWSYGQLLALRGRATRGGRWIAFLKTALAFLGVKHRGKARGLDLAYHHGFWRGLAFNITPTATAAKSMPHVEGSGTSTI
jgi:glycosyltransferase involved in cell wall biosynthesis